MDNSINGTFVNGVQLGKNNRSILKAMDEIALLPTKFARYIYKERSAPDEEDDGGPAKEYHIQKTLGAGNFASVKLGVHKVTGEKFAIKCIDKKKMVGGSSRADAVRDEINILERVSHPNIIRIFKNYETETVMYLVLELVEGGELFDYIVKRGDSGLPESSAREIFRQMTDAVAYLHGMNISHRDLKPENILLGKKPVDDNGPFIVKLSDFGLSRLVGQSNLMQTMCGTPSYLAPEVLGGGAVSGYGLNVDIWSMGVILYILLSGRHPFDESSSGVLDRVKAAQFSFDDRVWQDVSSEAMDCIQACLVVSPQKRIAAAQLHQHSFITGKPATFAVPMGGSMSIASPKLSAAPVSQSSQSSPSPAVSAQLNVAEPAMKKPKNLEGALPVCKYGQSCFRKNPQHFTEFAHPWMNK